MANNNIPLVRSNSVNDINTSIIAIKKELKANGETDINVNVDVNYPENAYPVDAVTDGDMHSVTSNAVFDKLNGIGGVAILTFPYTTFTAGTPYGQLNCNELLTEGVWLCTAYLLCGSMWFQGNINCTKDNVACSTFARVSTETDCRQEITFVVNIPKNTTSKLGLNVQNANSGVIGSDIRFWGMTCVKLANV